MTDAEQLFELFKGRLARTTCRIVDHLTYNYLDRPVGKPWPMSMTVPDMVMSMDEIIKRFTRGQAVPSMAAQFVEGDFTAYEDLDVFGRIDMSRKIANLRVKLMSEIDEFRRKDQEAADKERFEAALAAGLKAAMEKGEGNGN